MLMLIIVSHLIIKPGLLIPTSIVPYTTPLSTNRGPEPRRLSFLPYVISKL